MDAELAERLRGLAERFETATFVEDDPVGTLRGIKRGAALETAALTAASLSYGSRKQFLPKIEWLLGRRGGDLHGWVLSGEFEEEFRPDDGRSYYRLFSRALLFRYFSALREMLERHGSVGGYLRSRGAATGPAAVRALCEAFGGRAAPMVPKDDTSACKRLCLFLRWMARDGSPVDNGEWSGWFDKRTLTIPMDVHVVRQACRLGLLRPGATASMRTARALTEMLREVFPDDPCRGDFALYGLGVSGGC